jgi:hypothetical protein
MGLVCVSFPAPIPVIFDMLTEVLIPSLIEMQVFMARLVREFQFSEMEGKQIRICRPGLLVPIVVGEKKGVQLPLKVSAVRRGAYPHT